MCGWPSGVGFPPVDGESAQLTTVTAEGEAAEEAVDENVGAQLDALTTMAQRSLPVAEQVEIPLEAPVEAAEVNAVEVVAAVEVAEPAAAATAAVPQEVPELAMAGGVLTTTSVAPPALDPLTAPIEQVSELGERAAADLHEVAPDVALPPAPIQAELPAGVDGGAQPEPTADQVLGLTPEESPGTAKPTGIARVVSLLLVAVGVVGLANSALSVFASPEDGSTLDLGSSLAVLGVALVGLALWVACAVTFLVWLSRARTVSDAHSAVTPRHSRTFAIWCWLIPIAGFFFGWRVLQDLWTASDPATRMNSEAKRAEPGIISLWLGALVGASAISLAVPYLLSDMPTLNIAASALVLVSALALARIVTTVTAWQEAQAGSEPFAPVAPEATD